VTIYIEFLVALDENFLGCGCKFIGIKVEIDFTLSDNGVIFKSLGIDGGNLGHLGDFLCH
jgi:hypothetical protein